MDIQYNNQKKSLPFIFVAGSGAFLLERNWLQHIQLDWKEMCVRAVHPSTPAISLEHIQRRYESSAFSNGLGCVTLFKAKLLVKPDFPAEISQTQICTLLFERLWVVN